LESCIVCYSLLTAEAVIHITYWYNMFHLLFLQLYSYIVTEFQQLKKDGGGALGHRVLDLRKR
jgi:hypothetical protein